METKRFTAHGSADNRGDKDTQSTALASFGRMVGFIALAAPAMMILAAVVLVPEYDRKAKLELERDLLKSQISQSQSVITGYDRLIDASTRDEVLVRRMAINRLGAVPRNEIVMDGSGVTSCDISITPPAPREIKKRDDWILRMAPKLKNPPARRGLLLISLVTLAGAVLLFSEPTRKKHPPAAEHLSATEHPSEH